MSIGKHAPQMQPYTTVFIMHNPSHWICEYWKACSTDATIYNSAHNAPSIHHTRYVSIGKHAPQMQAYTTVCIIHYPSHWICHPSHWICDYWKACSTDAAIYNSAHNAPSIHQTGYVSIGKHAPQMQLYTTVLIMHHPSY